MITISDSSSQEDNVGKDEFENILVYLAPKKEAIAIEEEEEDEGEDYKGFHNY